MKLPRVSGNVGKSTFVFFLLSLQWFAAEGKFPVCSKSKEGNQTLYRKISGNDEIMVCLKNNGQYVWKFLDGSSTLGEEIDPAKDCTQIVNKLPDAKDGFYWLKLDKKIGPLKAWCDTHTNGGGFLLVGMKDSPVTWNVSTNGNPVHPLGPPHWSSKFGDVNVHDFAIQVSTTKNFEDTKAHWSYRLNTARAFGDLFGIGNGGCTNYHSGVGNVSYIKDILSGKVLTTNFKCSKFGPDVSENLGWRRMNYCLRNGCPVGYAFFKGIPFKVDSHGSFSFSASSEFSGITHNATSFVGCVSGKCCACFGPKGGKEDYCGRDCEALNGGTVLTGRVYVWYWIRTRLPQRVWKRCMEFKKKTQTGKFDTYFIDKKTGTAHKGTCSEHFQTYLNEGTLFVENKESFDNLPPVPGMISYREDNKKLYVNTGNEWDAIGSEEENKNLKMDMARIEQELKARLARSEQELTRLARSEQELKARLARSEQELKARLARSEQELKARLARSEQELKARLAKIEGKVPQIGQWPSGSYCILQNGNCPPGFTEKGGKMHGIRLSEDATRSSNLKSVVFGSSSISCHYQCNRNEGDLIIYACCK